MVKLVSVVLAVGLVVTGCSGTAAPTEPDQPPSVRIAEAKKSLDAAAYVGFTMHTAGLPEGVEGLLSANGTGTHAPAFTGTVKVHSGGVDFSAPIVAVNTIVYAKLPFAGWSQLNPADYGAPDPADLMARDGGVSSLLTATTDLRKGDTTRIGDEIYTGVSGTLPGSAVQQVFPSAGAGQFAVLYTLNNNNELKAAQITGPFYPGPAGDETYFIEIDVHAGSVDIQAPI